MIRIQRFFAYLIFCLVAMASLDLPVLPQVLPAVQVPMNFNCFGLEIFLHQEHIDERNINPILNNLSAFLNAIPAVGAQVATRNYAMPICSFSVQCAISPNLNHPLVLGANMNVIIHPLNIQEKALQALERWSLGINRQDVVINFEFPMDVINCALGLPFNAPRLSNALSAGGYDTVSAAFVYRARTFGGNPSANK